MRAIFRVQTRSSTGVLSSGAPKKKRKEKKLPQANCTVKYATYWCINHLKIHNEISTNLQIEVQNKKIKAPEAQALQNKNECWT